MSDGKLKLQKKIPEVPLNGIGSFQSGRRRKTLLQLGKACFCIKATSPLALKKGFMAFLEYPELIRYRRSREQETVP